MCTVSWRHSRSGYALYFNRDEQRSRPAAKPPRCRTIDGVACVTPRDPVGGGTWIVTNARGVTVAVMNFYDAAAGPGPRSPRSRGLLVRGLANLRAAADLPARVADAAPDAYRPFHLVAIDPLHAYRVTWDGAALTTDATPTLPLCTSSVDTAHVLASRRGVYARHVPAGLDAAEADRAHRAFHASHEPTRSAVSVCMHRPDAHTVSFTQVHVDAQTVTMTYWPDAPCRAAQHEPVVVTLARHREA